MANQRITYAIKQFAVKNNSSAATSSVLPLSASGVNPSGYFEVPRGIQSVATTTSFSLEQIFEMGKLAVYEQIEGTPEIEVTVNRVFDGTMPLYLIASDSSESTLIGRNATYKNDLALNIYPDTQDNAVGSFVSAVYISGAYLSSMSFTFPVDGNFTEEITFLSNNKFWAVETGGSMANGNFPSGVIATDEDPTVNVGNLDGVQRRENFDLTSSTFPSDIPGVVAGVLQASGECLQNVSITADLGREDVFCLGAKDARYKFVTVPVEVTTTIEAITTLGDLVEADASIDNLTNETIIIVLTEGLTINLGTQNKLSSVDMAGADAGGGSENTTFTYTNFNDLTITHSDYN